MSSLDPAAQPQVKSWRVRADEAGVAFFATATPALIILALAPASWQGLIFLVGLGCTLAASVRASSFRQPGTWRERNRSTADRCEIGRAHV